MSRLEALRLVLDGIMARRPLDAAAACEREYSASGDPYLLSLSAIALCFGQSFESGADAATRARTRSNDPEAVALALAATAWAGTCLPSDYPGDAIDEGLALAAALDGTPDDSRSYALYLLAEAALGSARLALADRVIAATGDLPAGFLADVQGRPHAYLAMMQLTRVRLTAFQGEVTRANALLDTLDAPHDSITGLLAEATRCLVAGNSAKRSAVRDIADRLGDEIGEPSDYIAAGCYILVAFGLVAVAELDRAAQFVLLAGRSAGLERLNLIDRALGLELLVAAACAQGDLSAAEAWRLQAEPLLPLGITRPTVERILSRVDLLAGRAAEAARWAELAIEHAAADGRAIEAAEGEIVLSRARIALSERGAASNRLERMAATAASAGHLAAQKSAARELRSLGRRLRPVAGSGWAGLSAREREVALLITQGFANGAIAAELHLSEHTVQAHVSRVLAAFGVASRLAVAAKLASELPRDPLAAPVASLTPRQWMVAEQVANGLTNEQIASALGVSVKTVEKHVSEILRRWQVSSRIGIARLVLQSQRDAG